MAGAVRGIAELWRGSTDDCECWQACMKGEKRQRRVFCAGHVKNDGQYSNVLSGDHVESVGWGGGWGRAWCSSIAGVVKDVAFSSLLFLRSCNTTTTTTGAFWSHDERERGVRNTAKEANNKTEIKQELSEHTERVCERVVGGAVQIFRRCRL